MPMLYKSAIIQGSQIPRTATPLLQHVLDVYAGETNKVAAIWRQFLGDDLTFRPHARSSTVQEIMSHQLLSERRFFGEFLGLPEPPAGEILPPSPTPDAYLRRLQALALPRLQFLAAQGEKWWLEPVSFFDVTRERSWIFWRRVLHTAHHRAQLGVYLRLLDRPVPAVYGPTADATWVGADPTRTVDAARRA